MNKRTALWVLSLVVAFTHDAPAAEWCRTAYTLALDGGAGPDAGDFLRTETSPDSGVCLAWATRTISYRIGANGSDNMSLSEAQQAVHDSFTSWSKENITACPSELTFSDLGTNASPVLNGNDRVNNVFWVESGWTSNPGHTAAAIALTTVSFYSSTGEIIDGDIEFNGQYYTFAIVDGGCTAKQDIQNTANREIGLLIGLDLTSNPEATMYGPAPSCDTKKRTLTSGDMLGVCQIYGPGQGLTSDAGSDAGSGADGGLVVDAGGYTDGGVDAGALTGPNANSSGCSCAFVSPVDRDIWPALVWFIVVACSLLGLALRAKSRSKSLR